jgi:hypothetical protein
MTSNTSEARSPSRIRMLIDTFDAGSSSSASASDAFISFFSRYVPGCSDVASGSFLKASTNASAVRTTPSSSSV